MEHFCLQQLRINHPKSRDLISENIECELKPSKILEVIWNEANDTVVFKFKELCDFSQALNATKTNVLKALAMLYDLIRFLKPIIIDLKIIFQKRL